MKKKILICVLCLTFFLSVSINIYYFLPHKVSESVSMGYYVSDYTNGEFYKLSIMQDNQVILYGPKNQVILNGKLESNQNENEYRITTESDSYPIVARDDTVFLPFHENGKINSKLLKKISSSSVTYS